MLWCQFSHVINELGVWYHRYDNCHMRCNINATFYAVVIKLCPDCPYQCQKVKEPKFQVLCLQDWQKANAFCALLLLFDNFWLIDINYETNDIIEWVQRYHVPSRNKTLTGHETRYSLCGFSKNIYRPFQWLWHYIERSHRGIDQQAKQEHSTQFQMFLASLVTSDILQYQGIKVLFQYL